MRICHVVLYSVLVTGSLAQINLDSVLSDVQSIFTSLTSALANPTTTSSSTSSQTTSSSTSSTTATTSSTSSSLTYSSITAASTTTPTSSAAAQSSSASSATESTANHSGSSNTLPIVLGCTLGALALAAFLALIFLCRRRRNRSKTFAKRRSQPSSDDESDSWNREKQPRHSFKGPTERVRSLGPVSATGTASRNHQLSHDNQHPAPAYGSYPDRGAYRPVSPTANQFDDVRHARDNDVNTFSAHPYSPDHVQQYGPHSEGIMSDRQTGSTLAAGVGGVAAGGMAANAANHHQARRSGSRSRRINGVDTPYSEDEHNTLPQADTESLNRTSGSVSRASVKEPWPYVETPGRTSTDSKRSRPRSTTPGRNSFNPSEQCPSDRHSMPSGAALAGSAAAGALVGTAANRTAGSRSPHRKGILKQTTSNQTSHSTSPDNTVVAPSKAARRSDAHELDSSEVPRPTRPSRDRRRSPLGYAAPAAAIGANHSPDPSHRRSWINGSNVTNAPSMAPPHDFGRDSDVPRVPRVPSRSPRRSSVRSNARYSSANEGTVELPGQEGSHGPRRQGFVSPNLEPHRGPADHEEIVSPVSPDTSLPGTWSRAHAQELGMNQQNAVGKSSSGESTAMGGSPLNSNSISSVSSQGESSGLVTAIQRIFNSPKQPGHTEESTIYAPSRRSFGDRNLPVTENFYEDNRNVTSLPHRKPAPASSIPYSQYGQATQDDVVSSDMPGSWVTDATPLQQTRPRHSGESARSVPYGGEKYHTRMSNHGEPGRPSVQLPGPSTSGNTHTNTNTHMNTGRSRSNSRPGYGVGSGDPFDLARIRTNSSMTGVPIDNYVEPPKNTTNHTSTANTAVTPHSHVYKTSSASNDYREPTLAELRREVQEEDRRRSASWRSTGRRSVGSRKSVEGQRYGSDHELFDLAIPGTQQYDHFYGPGQGKAGGVGTAY